MILKLLLPMLTAVAGAGFSLLFVCVCLSPHGISKTDAAKITNLDVQNAPP